MSNKRGQGGRPVRAKPATEAIHPSEASAWWVCVVLSATLGAFRAAVATLKSGKPDPATGALATAPGQPP